MAVGDQRRTTRVPPPHNAVAKKLDEAKAAFKRRYEEIKRQHQGQRQLRS